MITVLVALLVLVLAVVLVALFVLVQAMLPIAFRVPVVLVPRVPAMVMSEVLQHHD